MLPSRNQTISKSLVPKFGKWLLAALVVLSCSTAAHPSGIALYETGAPDLGTASAGRAAIAADASTSLTNPAGLTLLDRSQLMVAAERSYQS